MQVFHVGTLWLTLLLLVGNGPIWADTAATAPDKTVARDPRYPAKWWTPAPKKGAPEWEILPQEAG